MHFSYMENESLSSVNQTLMRFIKRWSIVALYAIAIAWVESVVVLDMRTLTGQMDPYSHSGTILPGHKVIARAEMVREAATMAMLLAVGWLAGKTLRGRIGYAAIAFGVWDIFYYVFLKVLTDWPNSLFDWDILFLLPLPWWGPVLAPVLIALLMILWGTLATAAEDLPFPAPENWKAWGLALAGIFIALYVFMTDALRVAGEGREALAKLLPQQFNWPLFLLGLLLMAVPVLNELRNKVSEFTLLLAVNRIERR
jgi:hypothetical protein